MTIKERAAPVSLVLIWALVVVGVAAIFFDTWLNVAARYTAEGIETKGLMLIVMGGIPSIAYAGVVYVGLSWLLLPKAKPAPVAPVAVAPPKPVAGENYVD